MSHPFRLVTPPEMRALEETAFQAGTAESELQERAGRAVAQVILESAASKGARIAVLVGAGNNGRDGVVAARYLVAAGYRVQAWFGPRPPLNGSELAGLSAAGIEARVWGGEGGSDHLRAGLRETAVAIDALFGIGLRGPMDARSSAAAEVLNEVRAARRSLSVVAVDVPSGVNAEDGSVPGVAVRADVTVTFGAVKTGLLRFPGAELVGRLEPRAIGLPPEAAERHPVRILDRQAARPLVPTRPLDAHKYRFGRVLVVAGSETYVGAAYLCSAAAARSGCGLVGVAATETVRVVLATRLPEATYPLGALDAEGDPDGAADRLTELLPEYQGLLIGPGLGRSTATDRFVRRLLVGNAQAERPVRAHIDADALTLLAGWDRWWEQIGQGHILTPHAGEMARLAGGDAQLQDRPWEAARRWADAWGQVIVLKGPFTSIAGPGGDVWVHPHPNAALATAGTGDVLAGLCVGLSAQGLGAPEAARLAVMVHGLAARRVVDARGWRTLLASDLVDEIPAALRALDQDRP